MNIEKAQSLVNNDYRGVLPKSVENDENFLCLVAGKAGPLYFVPRIYSIGLWVLYILLFIFPSYLWITLMELLGGPIQELMWKINPFIPISIGGGISFGRNSYCHGWVYSFGIFGANSWSGNNLSGGAIVFTGFKIQLTSERDYFFIGKVRAISIRTDD